MTASLIHLPQIKASLPTWATHLPAADAQALLKAQRKPYLDEHGQPLSWFDQASAAQQQLLREQVSRRDSSHRALARALAGQQSIHAFCAPLLAEALGLEIAQVTRATYSFWGFNRGGSRVTIRGPHSKRSLLEAALHNFEDNEDVGPFTQLLTDKDSTEKLPGLDVPTFIARCRTLDLGGAYQRHLAQIHDGEAGARLKPLAIQARQDELRVQAVIARIRGHVTESGYQMLVQLADGRRASYAGRTASCRQLTLFGHALHEVLLIGPDDETQMNPCIVYTPGEPLFPLKEYSSLSDYRTQLHTELLREEVRTLLSRYVVQNVRMDFLAQLDNALYETRYDGDFAFQRPRATLHLPWTLQPLPESPWERLHSLQVGKLKADARAIAVPTADVNAAARLTRLQHWLDTGLTVLNVAALFIPALNPIMLAVAGSQLMDSLFHGVENWEEGDAAQASAYLGSVLANVAVVTYIGTLTAPLARFANGLHSVELASGESRLWSPGVRGYASDTRLDTDLRANDLGQYEINGKYYLHRDGELFDVSENSQGHWQLNHPRDPEAFRPRVLHNGQGAWRLEGERPLAWSDAQLLRRLGPITDGLSNEELGQLAQCTGITPQMLGKVHLDSLPAPSTLVAALKLARCDKQVQQLIDATRDGLAIEPGMEIAAPLVAHLPRWPVDRVLQVFEGPETWGASSTYGLERYPNGRAIKITRSAINTGRLAESILAALPEDQAKDLFSDNLSSAERPRQLRADIAQLMTQRRSALIDQLWTRRAAAPSPMALRLQSQFPSLADTVLEDIAGHASETEVQALHRPHSRPPLRLLEEARLLQARTRLDRALIGLYRPHLLNADSQRLVLGLLQEHAGWTGEIRLELRSALPDDALIASAGPATASQADTKVIRPGNGGYRATDGDGNELAPGATLFEQILNALPDRERQSLGNEIHDPFRLRQALQRASQDRDRCARLLGQQPPRPGFRSPLRLSDGRIGYPLSGRQGQRLPYQVVMQRLRQLFPLLDDQELLSVRQQLGLTTVSAQQLQALESEYLRLSDRLSSWENQHRPSFAELGRRQMISERIRQAWRRSGSDNRHILDLSHLPTVDSLPDLASVSFEHIKVLNLRNLGLLRVESNFLRRFPNLETLNVAANRLNADNLPGLFEAIGSLKQLRRIDLREMLMPGLPEGALAHLASLPRLNYLDLSFNVLSLSARQVEAISQMPLQHLDLSHTQLTLNAGSASSIGDMVYLRTLSIHHNPLQIAPNLSFMAELQTLNLSACELDSLPTGLISLLEQRNYQLTWVDLSHNRITAISELDRLIATPFIRNLPGQMPSEQYLSLNYNLLPSQTRLRLATHGVRVLAEELNEHLNLDPTMETSGNRQFWLDRSTEQQQHDWDALFANNELPALNGVLDRLSASREAQANRAQLTARVMQVLQRATTSTELRSHLEELAEAFPPTCGDAGADAFSTLELEVKAFTEGLSLGAGTGKQLVGLFNQIYRRQLVEQLADEIALRRSLRLGAITEGTELPALNDLDNISDATLRSGVDAIEIRLALRQDLATPLDYPEPSQGMLYRDMAHISTTIRENVATRVRSLETDVSERQKWMVKQPGWAAYLRRHYAEQLQITTDFWQQGLEYLDYCAGHSEEAVTTLSPSVRNVLVEQGLAIGTAGDLPRPSLTDQQYWKANNALLKAKDEAEHALLISLTRSIELAPTT